MMDSDVPLFEIDYGAKLQRIVAGGSRSVFPADLYSKLPYAGPRIIRDMHLVASCACTRSRGFQLDVLGL
jgi:hypothetical protein